MSQPVIIEAGYTKFNLSYPLAVANYTPVADLDGDEEATIPGVLFGILVPHIVCTLFILARAWSRLVLLRKWFLDDTLILLAWAFSTAVCIIYSIASQSRDPRSPISTTAVPLAQLTVDTATIRTYTSLILYQLTLLLTKLSILSFYYRIFSPATTHTHHPQLEMEPSQHHHHHHHRLERHLTVATTAFTILYGIPLLAMSALQCHPVQGYFFARPMDRCFAFSPLLISSTALHTATDAWLIVLIIPCVLRLKEGVVSRRQKAVLGVVLSLGVFVIVAGLVRLRLSLGMPMSMSGDGGDGAAAGEDEDGVKAAGTLAFFVMTVLELDVALICASAPTLRPVLARMGMRGLMVGGRGGRGDAGSVDLTSVVSYHGYPWTRDGSVVGAPRGVGSKSGSVVDLERREWPGEGAPPLPVVPVPPPPVAMAMHRTPTTLSLKSFMSNMAPRSRGRVEGEERTGLLGGESQEGMASRRRSSVGLEAYYEQFVGYDVSEKRGSRAETRRSRGSQCYSGQWADSQESFVLGMNDPHSPKRLSPMSSLSEATKEELRRPASQDEKGSQG